MGDAGPNLVAPVLADERLEVQRADVHRPELGAEVTGLIPACAGIDQEEVEDVAALAAGVVDLDGRDPQALGEDLASVGVVAARGRAAGVGHVALAHRPEQELAVDEHRLVHAPVGDVAAVVGGVVVEHHVAGAGVAAEERGHRLGREDQRAQVDGQVLTLNDHRRGRVEDRVGEVARDREDARAPRALHGQRHLALGRLERALDDRKRDRIDVGAAPRASWSSTHQHPAVDVIGRAGDVSGCLGGQERGERGHLLGRPSRWTGICCV